MTSLTAYENLPQARQANPRNRVSYQINLHGIDLLSALNMIEEKVRYVCAALKGILEKSREGRL